MFYQFVVNFGNCFIKFNKNMHRSPLAFCNLLALMEIEAIYIIMVGIMPNSESLSGDSILN